ncbi:macro domain-containing protein [Erwinia sp. MYb375]|uniref:macro domain-containing protein n=2 Tax=Erwinia TaxID=551 RepID=UPI0030AD8E1A
MFKVGFFDQKVRSSFYKYVSGITGTISGVVLFWDIPENVKNPCRYICPVVLMAIYIAIWVYSNRIKSINLSVEGSTVTIKTGDIFAESGFKVIAFNEYFDTQVDEKIIAAATLNGMFIQRNFTCSVEQLDEHISQYPFSRDEISSINKKRPQGKKQKYGLGTICVWEDFLLTAFSKFDNHNEARLTMPEYLMFLINFWDRVNRVYAQKSVTVPIFGSGIVRIKEHKNITAEDLLKIMLWTFRISEMRFAYPAKLTIIIHKDKIDKINLFEIQSARNGL